MNPMPPENPLKVVPPANDDPGPGESIGERPDLIEWLKRTMGLGRINSPENLRRMIEDFIHHGSEATGTEASSVERHEKALIGNILKLRDMKVHDVMIPRADIVAIEIQTSKEDLLSLLAEKQFSRIPVYRETLDDVVGTIHIKDILSTMARGQAINIAALVRDIPIVSPSMHVFDLIILMRNKRKHMVMVVDEYGGIDGLATIGDVIEAIVGEIEDEHTGDDDPELIENANGTLLVDGRYSMAKLLETCGPLLGEEESAGDVDTLAGFIFALAGRVPARGEIIAHPSGLVFEITDADPRRVNRVMIRNRPVRPPENPS